MAFFARHFMKNKKETTARHYNLLSNQRHAVSIAMKLYDTITGPDGVDFSVDSTTVDQCPKCSISQQNLSKRKRC